MSHKARKRNPAKIRSLRESMRRVIIDAAIDAVMPWPPESYCHEIWYDDNGEEETEWVGKEVLDEARSVIDSVLAGLPWDEAKDPRYGEIVAERDSVIRARCGHEP